MKKMEGERPHRSGSSSSELFICFTSRPSSSSNASSMKISSKSILSPGRTDKLREGATTLPSSLSRRLRSNGSMKGGQSSPMFPTGSKKKGCAFETPEPSSPKVTCIGQVRVKTKKQGKKMRTRSKRRGGDGSFRKTEQTQEGQMQQQQQQQECLPNRNQRWVHLPLSICEALRAFGAEFNCFVPCGGRSSCSSSNAGMEREKGEKRTAAPAGGTPTTSSCGTVFAKWLMALQESEEGKRREIVGEMVGIVGAEDEEEKEKVEEKKGEQKAQVEIEEEEDVDVCIPPRNALLLMRCRSEPLRMSSLANRFWDSPAQKEEENEEEEDDDDDDEEEHDYEEAVEEEQQMVGKAKQKEDETLEKAVSAQEHETLEEEEEHGEAQEQKEEDEEEEELRVENGSSGVCLEEQENPQEEDKGKEETQLQKPEEEESGEGENKEETQLQKTEEEKEIQLQKVEEEEKETQLQKTEEEEKEIQLQEKEEEEKEAQLQKTAEEEEEKETHFQKTEEEQKETQLQKTEEGEEEKEEREEKMVEERRRSSCSTASVQLEKEEEAEAILEEERSTEGENEKTEGVAVESTEAAAAAESEEEKPTVEEKRKVEGREERERPVQLPDCLLLMMCEPKLSMEVSRETWVCSTDFLRCRPDKAPAKGPAPPPPPPSEATGKKKEGAADDCKRLSTDSNPAKPPPANPAHQQPLSMATVIEQKLVNAVAYEPFVLTRCKSEPVRSSARLAPEACFWKSRKLPPHQPPVGVGAAGVGF